MISIRARLRNRVNKFFHLAKGNVHENRPRKGEGEASFRLSIH